MINLYAKHDLFIHKAGCILAGLTGIPPAPADSGFVCKPALINSPQKTRNWIVFNK